VPGGAVWYPLEPNSYKNFGGDVKLKARQPINASRQMKKGVVVDLDAQGGWQQDLTQTNFQQLAPYFFFAAMRTKSELSVAAVDGTANAYQPPSGGNAYYAGDLLFAKSFTQSANNGLKKATGVPVAANILVTDAGLLTEAGASGVISRVGYEYGAGQLTVDISDSLPKIKVVTVPATGVLTTTGTFSNGETVVIGGITYLLQSAFTAGAGHVKIAGSTALTLTNLANAINQTGAGVPGTDYDAASTPANVYVTATSDATHLNLTARASGAVGNSVTTVETAVNASFGAGTLTGGSGGRGLDSFGLIPGEFLFLGDDAVRLVSSTAPATASAAFGRLPRARFISTRRRASWSPTMAPTLVLAAPARPSVSSSAASTRTSPTRRSSSRSPSSLSAPSGSPTTPPPPSRLSISCAASRM
jgi:hypothetical protein